MTLKKTAIALALAAMAVSTAACNTVRGAGQDLESVANDVDKAV